MPQCKRCGMMFMSHELDRNELCENCARQARASNARKSKPKACARCGNHGLFLYIEPDGFCENCRPFVEAERRERQRRERASQNYQLCQNGTARHDVQRIYDAFRAKYPNALIVGIEPKDEDRRMIVHLEGGDLYNAVFNALTNDVDVTKVGAPGPERASNYGPAQHSVAAASAKPEKSYGLACVVSVLSLLYNIFLLLFSYAGGFVGVISSLVALVGSISKARTAIVFGACFLILSLVLSFPYSIVNIIFFVFLLAAS